ncbi:uncharacterized protein LOC105696246 isoform X1 [Orussus abietinus]|uniref:uncharacterized protein LOC105696246 isoform X1 n=1 Tax=Orussus abietinus TaxID=222816 RepID=UPI000C715B16|nr:uncharacterized protein LOC105696246 isoform X1 [Orussus abietinus]
MQINGQTIEVYKIERTLYKEARSIQKIQTFMTRDGRILQHDWLEVQYLLQINPLIDLKKFGSQKQSEALTMRTPWHEDMELISKYLDTKTCKAAQQSEYLADQPQMKQLIFDYVQALLIVKPSDVLNFTIQHFKSFAKYPERGEVSLSEEESEINVSSQFREKDSTLCKTCKICVDCKMLKTAPVVPIGEQFAELLQYPPIEPESPTFSSCSVRTKCSSDALCVRRQTRGNLSVTCINDCKPCNSDEIHTHFLDCVKTCEGCQRLSKPCPVHRVRSTIRSSKSILCFNNYKKVFKFLVLSRVFGLSQNL